MKTKRYLIIISIILMGSGFSYAQSPHEKEMLRRKRFRIIEFYHASIGIDFSANKGIYASPRASFGVGSYRNLINADVGFKFTTGNPFFFDDDEHLVPQQIAAFASLQLNVMVWKTNCIFIGVEMAYCIPVTSLHYLPSSSIIEYDRQAGHQHFSSQVNVGVKLNNWRISMFYEYDLAPALNQKYVFESANYDYDNLRNVLFERDRIGISITYQFPFSL